MFELAELNHILSKYSFSQLIKDIVNYFEQVISSSISLYRTCEYQFTLVSLEHDNLDEFVNYCEKVAVEFERMIFNINEKKLCLSLFIGIAERCMDMDPYIKANQAIKLAEGTCQKISVFRPQHKVLKAITESVDWTQSIKQAIQTDDFAIFGQRIFDAHKNVYSTEVLMRHFDNKTNTYTSPYVFLDYACKAKLYDRLTQSVIEKSFAYFGFLNERFSINMTYMDICDESTMALLQELLLQYQCGSRLTIELVESDSLNIFSDDFKCFLNMMKHHGCLLAIDDFGSGYSNFNYLTQLPVDIVKIDGTLIQDIDSNEINFVTVKAIVEICQVLNVKTVAEYVANQAIYEKLKTLKIDYFQGFLFDKPTPLPCLPA